MEKKMGKSPTRSRIVRQLINPLCGESSCWWSGEHSSQLTPRKEWRFSKKPYNFVTSSSNSIICGEKPKMPVNCIMTTFEVCGNASHITLECENPFLLSQNYVYFPVPHYDCERIRYLSLMSRVTHISRRFFHTFESIIFYARSRIFVCMPDEFTHMAYLSESFESNSECYLLTALWTSP